MEREFQEQSLANGINLHNYQTDRFRTVSFKFFIQQPLGPKAGASALLPFILRRGCLAYPTSQALAKGLEQLYGAIFQAHVIKLGERQLIQFSLEVPREDIVEDPGLIKKGLQTLGKIITEPLVEDSAFHQEYFQQEKTLLLRKIDGLINDKPRYAIQRLFEEMCPDEPFGISQYGSREEIQGLDNTHVYEHYQQICQAGADLFVVGHLPTQELTQMVEGIFPKGWQGGDLPAITKGKAQGKEVMEEQDVRQGILAMGLRTNATYKDDSYPALLFYNGILGAFPHSKLFINVREKASLAYFAFSRLEVNKGVLVASAGIDVEKYEQARDIIQKQIHAIATGQITEEEIAATRRGLIHQHLTIEDSADALIDNSLKGIINGRKRRNHDIIKELEQVDKEMIIQVAQEMELDITYFLRSHAGEGN